MSTATTTNRGRLLLALICVYVLWGSTYLAIKYAIETLPPFLMAGARFVMAGTLLYAWTRWRGTPAPRREQWKPALVGGALLMLVSNGLVCWSELRVDSSLVALFVGTVPLWMMLFDWLRPGGARPSVVTVIGVAIGIAGVALLVWPEKGGNARPLDLIGAAAALCAPFAWAAGSIYSRGADLPRSPLLATAMHMLCGGVLQLICGTLIGEWSAFDPSRVTWLSVGSLVYLMIAGSLIGFTSYVWLLRNTTPALASSYAFVNPLVAVLLGVGFGHEVLRSRTLFAAAFIVTAVVLVITFRSSAAPAPAKAARQT